MKKLVLADIMPLQKYEVVRNERRKEIIAYKKNRRINVGKIMTLVFENRKTLTFQIQEIMRIERIEQEEKIQEEIDSYNTIIPDTNELSATLFIEIIDQSKVQEALNQLMGIDEENTVFLVIGSQKISAIFEAGHSKEDKISAVHYLRFRLSPDQQQDLANLQLSAEIMIDHPHYQAKADLSAGMRQSLLLDF